MEDADHYMYEEGEMVTVNCGASKTEVTPFRLGQIMDVRTSPNGSVSVEVQWFDLVPGQGDRICRILVDIER